MSTTLDDFNRLDGGIGSNWDALGTPLGLTIAQIESNVVKSGGGNGSVMMWNVQSFTDVEAEITVTTRPSDGQKFELSVRVTNDNPITGLNGYVLSAQAASGTDQIILQRMTNLSPTNLFTFPHEIVAGEQYRLRAVGSTISCYYKPVAGDWTLITSVTDTTWTTGRIGFTVTGSQVRIDNFVGGVPATNIDLAGTTTVTFTPAADLTTLKQLVGTGSLTFAPVASVTVLKPLASNSDLVFSPSASLSVLKELSGLATLNFDTAASLVTQITLSGSSIVAFETVGDLVVQKQLDGATTLLFTLTGNIIVHREITGTPSRSRTIIVNNEGRGIIVYSRDERSIIIGS